LLGGFVPESVTGSVAADIVRVADDLERAASALKLLAAGRVEETGLHERLGHRSCGSWLADVTKEPVGRAVNGLETLKASKRHRCVEEAFRTGSLSVERARQIASAADAFPERALSLVRGSSSKGFEELKKACEDVRDASRSAEDEIRRHERMRRSRSCRLWKDHDGFGRIDAKLTSDAMAVVKGCLESFERDVFEVARKKDIREPKAAYMADALVSMAEAALRGPGSSPQAGPEGVKDPSDDPAPTRTVRSPTRPRCLVRIRVDLEALRRGYSEPGDTCEIPGVGKVAVPIARAVLGESLLQMVITNGTDVSTVVSDSRYVRRALRIALEERDPTCVVPHCNASEHLEIDHWQTDYSNHGPTEMANLCRLCGWHHARKTHDGWVLEGGPGNWRFEERYVNSTGEPLEDWANAPPEPEANGPPGPPELF